LASINTHFFSMSAALAEYVLMRSIHGNRGTEDASGARLLHAAAGAVNAL
jgi:hypothetical protein